MDARFEDVVAVLQVYFDGLYAGDTVKLGRAFHPDAHYMTATEGKLLHLTMADYFPIVDRRPSPASQGEARRDRVLGIEFAGPVTAFARVECAVGRRFFTDFLTLVCVDGQWRIVSKVFHFEISA